MSIWNGTILGNLHKHRDFAHSSFYDHARDGGLILGFRLGEDEDGEFADIIEYDIEELVEEELEAIRAEAERLLHYWFTRNPITGAELQDPELFYALAITLSGSPYDYFINAIGDGLPPPPQVIRETLDRYMENQDVDRSEIAEWYDVA